MWCSFVSLCGGGDDWADRALGFRRAGAVDLLYFGGSVGFAAAFNKHVPLESVLAGEAFVAVAAGERLDGKMDALVALEIVIPVEALRALIASEGPVVCWVWLYRVVWVHMLHRSVSTVVWHRHSRCHTIHQCQLSAWVTDVRQHWAKRRRI